MFTSYARRAAVLAAIVHLWSCYSLVGAQERTEFPAEARQQYDLGRALQKKGQLTAAIDAFEEAIKLGMEAFPRVYLQKASSHLDLKKYDAAIAQYTKFIDKFGLEDSCRY